MCAHGVVSVHIVRVCGDVWLHLPCPRWWCAHPNKTLRRTDEEKQREWRNNIPLTYTRQDARRQSSCVIRRHKITFEVAYGRRAHVAMRHQHHSPRHQRCVFLPQELPTHNTTRHMERASLACALKHQDRKLRAVVLVRPIEAVPLSG